MLRPPRHSGPLPALPAPLDALARGWAAASGRLRLAARTVVAGGLIAAALGGVVRGPWGPPVDVLVTTRPVAAGVDLDPGDVAVERRPAGLVPAGALVDVAALPADALAAGPLPSGAVVTEASLHPDGPGSLATDGTAVVAVDGALLPPLPVGTRLDVAVPGLDGSASVAARDAEVVADDGTWRWLRVGRGEVAALAAGVSEGRLVAAVLPSAR